MVTTDLPSFALGRGPRLMVVEGASGPGRRRCLQQWLDDATAKGASTWLLRCDFDRTGPWAGLRDLLNDLLPRIEATAPELIAQHRNEILYVLPELRRSLQPKNLPLTDRSIAEEKVRNYPMDRAYRIVQGLIDLVGTWQDRVPSSDWVIACDRFDHASALVKRFFHELLRRRGADLRLTLVLAVDPGAEVAARVRSPFPLERVRPSYGAEPEPAPDPDAMGERALALEAEAQNDPFLVAVHLPELVYSWLHSRTPERARLWQGYAFGEYNHHGFYEDALRYGEPIVEQVDDICTGTIFTRWNIVGAIANCYLALGRPESALNLIEREGVQKIEDPIDQVRVRYVLALIYSRFLPIPDFERAEVYIQEGLHLLSDIQMDETERCFLKVFTINGLAYVRHRQGRPEEAVRLCREGFAELEATLSPEQHRLHRSVLLYNIAQVYHALHQYEMAIDYYSGAVSFDPFYSEYYNERGNAYLALGRHEEAIADYRRAVETSSPYYEAWTNLGQALKLAGRHTDAVEAYSRALDLDPDKVLPRLGRAQAHEALGHLEAALADYSVALELGPRDPQLLANRASLLFEIGSLAAALADLDEAVGLAPATPELRYNRSLALEGLGRTAEAAADLEAYLALTSEPPDLQEVRGRLSRLQAGDAAESRARLSGEPQPMPC